MIKIKNNQEYIRRLSDEVDKNSNMVIIGDGKTQNFHKQLMYFDNAIEVEEIFGDSPLTLAFKDAQHFGCQYIFLINSTMKYDYIDISNILMQYDFAYIVPTNVLLTDYFINPKTNNKTYYLEYMLEQMSEYNNSHIIATDIHAALFDDIDAFILHMKTGSDSLSNRFRSQSHKLNSVSHVANNLYKYEFANVALAASLCSSKLNEYPSREFGEAVFDIDELDTDNMDFVFFQNNLNSTSVEHLFNLNKNNSQRKDVMIDRVIRYIKRNLTFDEYLGTPYSGQQNITIRNKVISFMDQLTGLVIENYYIKNIYFEKERVFVGNIVIELEITPIGRAESITVLTRS